MSEKNVFKSADTTLTHKRIVVRIIARNDGFCTYDFNHENIIRLHVRVLETSNSNIVQCQFVCNHSSEKSGKNKNEKKLYLIKKENRSSNQVS